MLDFYNITFLETASCLGFDNRQRRKLLRDLKTLGINPAIGIDQEKSKFDPITIGLMELRLASKQYNAASKNAIKGTLTIIKFLKGEPDVPSRRRH